MSTTHTLFTLAFVLFTYRLARLKQPGLKSGAQVPIRAALQTAVLVPLLATRVNWYYLAAMIALINASDTAVAALSKTGSRGKRPGKNEYTPETIGLFIRVGLILLVAGNPRLIPGFNSLARALAALIRANSVTAASITEKGFRDLLLMTAGVLLAGFDINCVVALILKQSHLMPTDDRSDSPAVEEAGRGRIIGILERSIVFVLVIRGQVSAVGLILAAKAIARFKDLDQRDFAEYVLIGTLLSISLAIAVALFLRSM